MDTISHGISISQLIALHGTAQAPLMVDVRRKAAFEKAATLIAGATWRDPAALTDWTKYLPRHRRIATYCVHGHEISKNTTEALIAEGFDAVYLEGGIEAWTAAAGPTVKRNELIPSAANQPTRWITRERPKVDRIACPWLIRRFIDPLAEFLYVPASEVAGRAVETGALPYDVPGVVFTHRGERCSFDAFIDDFALQHPALNRLADIVRGADTDRLDLTPQSAGLLAVSLGMSANIRDDHAMLAAGITVYDALYAWCKQTQAGTAERHNWTGRIERQTVRGAA
jgi:rhodanese-related sulfurtransferase